MSKKTIFECDYSGEQVVAESMPEGWYYIKEFNVFAPGGREIVIGNKHFSSRKNLAAMIRSSVDGESMDFDQLQRQSEMTPPQQPASFEVPRPFGQEARPIQPNSRFESESPVYPVHPASPGRNNELQQEQEQFNREKVAKELYQKIKADLEKDKEETPKKKKRGLFRRNK